MPHLDAAMQPDRARAAGATGVARLGERDVGHRGRRPVAAVVDVDEVVVGPVRAGDEVRRVLDRHVGDDLHAVAEADRRGGPGDEAERLDLGVAHRAQRAAVEGVRELDLVDLQVAAHHGEDRLVRLAAALGHVEDGLGGLRLGDVEERRELVDRLRPRRGDLLHLQRVCRDGGRPDEGGLLGVGGVAARVAERDHVLAGLREEDELLRALPADRARVGLDRHGRHAAAREDAPVRLEHRLVRGVEPRLVEVEGVGVLHRELAHAHQAAAGTGLVAELGLDLVERHRHVAV